MELTIQQLTDKSIRRFPRHQGDTRNHGLGEAPFGPKKKQLPNL
jgi:hypothetical protein